VSPCRASLVVCAAPHPQALLALKRATVAAEWEVSTGATSAEGALQQLEDHHAFALVVQEPVPGLVTQARERFPDLRIVAVGEGSADGADLVVGSADAVRAAILGLRGEDDPAPA
jgi:collagenase-like PrtC family protease